MTDSGRYTTPFGFSSLFAFCGLPLRLDSYKGCAFRCSYCYARARESANGSPLIRPADPVALARLLRRVFVDQRDDLSVVGECLRHRVPVHLGVMGDPFQPAETRHRVTLSYLRAALDHRYPMVISTRGALVAETPYLELLKTMDAVVVRMSLSTTDDRRSLMLERGEVSPSKVLGAMERLSTAGIRVSCRWQPFVPELSEDPEVFAPRIASTGCRQCSFEFLRLPRETNPHLVRGFRSLTGEDPIPAYRKQGAKHRVREYILPAEIRLPMILRARTAIRSAGMTFGAADNDLQYLSDTACCCSGADALDGFDSFFRHQIAYAVRQSFGKRIEYQVIANEWAPAGSIDRYLNSARGLHSKTDCLGTTRDHIAHRWNTSGLEGSPDFFYGVEATDERSSDGNLVYRWNADALERLRATPSLPSHLTLPSH
jgi:DNA repair photolyase